MMTTGRAAHPGRARSGPGRRLWLLWLLGLLVTVALTTAAWTAPYFPGDVVLARAVQAADRPALDALFRAINWAGGGIAVPAFTVLAAIAFLLLRRLDLLAGFLLLQALRPVSTLLKWLTGRPRPAAELVTVTEYHAGNRSFPSGHVMTSVLLYGALALLVEWTPLPRAARRAVQVVALAVVLLMGPARVYVGAHWPSDALGGYLWGVLILIGVVHAIPWCRARWHAYRTERPSGGRT